DRLQKLGLLVALRFMLFAGRGVHHHIRKNLQHVVLNHIAEGADGVVEAAPVLNAKGFRHGDLDAANIIAIPRWLEHRVGEPRVEDVLNWLLAEIVVDAKDRFFGEIREQGAVERLSRLAIAAERLLDDDARVGVEAALGERGDHDTKQARRNREIVERPLGAAERLFQLREGLRIVVVSIDIAQEPQELGETRGIGAPVLFDAVCRAGAQLIDAPAGFRDSDDRVIDALIGHETQERREDLLESEIAGSAEEHQSVGLGGLHRSSSWSWQAEPNVITLSSGWPTSSPLRFDGIAAGSKFLDFARFFAKNRLP